MRNLRQGVESRTARRKGRRVTPYALRITPAKANAKVEAGNILRRNAKYPSSKFRLTRLEQSSKPETNPNLETAQGELPSS